MMNIAQGKPETAGQIAEALLSIAARFAELPDLPPGAPDAFTQRQSPALLSRLATKIASPDPAMSAVGRDQLVAIAASWRDRKAPGWALWAEALAAIGEPVPEPVAAPVEQGAGQNSIALLLAAAYERGRAKGREEGGSGQAMASLQPLFSEAMDPPDLIRCARDLLDDAGREIDALVARVAELERKLEAAPGGVAVAGLLAELQRQREDGLSGTREAIEAARRHLTAPTPEQKAAAEVLALPLLVIPDASLDPVNAAGLVEGEGVEGREG